jgi:hypothetical protein
MTDYDQQRDRQRHIFVPEYRDTLDARMSVSDIGDACVESLNKDAFPEVMKLHDMLMYYKKEVLDQERDPNLKEVIKGLYLIASEYRMALKDKIMG